MNDETERKVFWRGRQWCVTDFGLETVDPDQYYWEARKLGILTEGAGQPMAETLRHIGDKTWVDIEELAAAFAIALQVHAGKFPPLPDGALLNSIDAMRASRFGSDEYRRLTKDQPIDAFRGDATDAIIASHNAVQARREAGPPFSEIGEAPEVLEQRRERERQDN